MAGSFRGALLLGLAVLAASALAASARELQPTTCDPSYLSCPTSSSTGTSNTCCSPKYGLMVLAVQWTRGLGPSNSFTLHGLWPDKCSGAQVSNCRSSGVSSVLSVVQANATLLSTLNTYWASYNGPSTNPDFWNNEFNKHGTCFSPVDPACYASNGAAQGVLDYFTLATGLLQQYDMYGALSAAGYTPSSSTRLTPSAIQKAVQAKYPGLGVEVACSDSKVMFELRLYFKVKGRNTFVPAPAHSGGSCGSVPYGKK